MHSSEDGYSLIGGIGWQWKTKLFKNVHEIPEALRVGREFLDTRLKVLKTNATNATHHHLKCFRSAQNGYKIP